MRCRLMRVSAISSILDITDIVIVIMVFTIQALKIDILKKWEYFLDVMQAPQSLLLQLKNYPAQ